jgi:poly(A) polymerase
LVQIFFRGGKIIEVSTFRRRSEFDVEGENNAAAPEMLAADNTFGTPEDDAFRRDLTINALFYEIDTFSIIDYTGGVQDLDDGIIRLIGEPERRIMRDPVRMMRVIRHAARNGFAINEPTWRAIKEHRDKLRLCPVSRIRDELLKDLRGGASQQWVKLALDSGLFTVLFPVYEAALAAFDQGEQLRGQLTALLGIVDRCHRPGEPGETKVQVPEHILFALILLPWAIAELDILNQNLKGAEVWRFARQLRDQLDAALAHFHIKRATRETMTSLFTNLHHIARHAGNWPDWLTRKSYFGECRRLFEIWQEVQGSKPVGVEALGGLAAAASAEQPKTRRRGRGRRTGRPAFSQESTGGIFGLKKGLSRRQ